MSVPAFQTHFGDPCIHCSVPHDDVAPGACPGDASKAVVIAYCVDRQAWQKPGSGCDTILCLMSTGAVSVTARHPSEHWPYSAWFKNARTMSRDEFARASRRTPYTAGKPGDAA
jgi:hypothetical protein